MLVFSRSISSPIEPVASRRNSTSTATGASAPPAAPAASSTVWPGAAVADASPVENWNAVAVAAPYSAGWNLAVPSAVVRMWASVVPSDATSMSAPATGRPDVPVTVTTMRPVGSKSRSPTPSDRMRVRYSRYSSNSALSSTLPARRSACCGNGGTGTSSPTAEAAALPVAAVVVAAVAYSASPPTGSPAQSGSPSNHPLSPEAAVGDGLATLPLSSSLAQAPSERPASTANAARRVVMPGSTPAGAGRFRGISRRVGGRDGAAAHSTRWRCCS